MTKLSLVIILAIKTKGEETLYRSCKSRYGSNLYTKSNIIVFAFFSNLDFKDLNNIFTPLYKKIKSH